MEIKNLFARQILDSRGTPTVEVDVLLNDGSFGRAASPSGASTGVHEAHELRDEEAEFNGKGVRRAVGFVNSEIKSALMGVRADDQSLVDKKMIDLDGTENKSRLGANSILAVSLACAHAAARSRGLLLYRHINDIAGNPEMSIPLAMMNVLNGGKHASNSSDFQEYMIIPRNASSYSELIKIGAEIFQSLKMEIAHVGGSTAVGDEGGFTFKVGANTQMLDLLGMAVQAAGYKVGQDVGYGLDVAASEFFENGKYQLRTENRTLNNPEMVDYLVDITNKYPVISIEDGLDQDEWDAWKMLTQKLGDRQLVGDDLLVTNKQRLQRAIEQQSANAILIKPNQIGTLSETIEAVRLAKANNFRTIISHRSGETEDVSIAHIATGLGAEQIKTGSLSRSERTAKHNELMRLEQIDESLKLANPFS